MEITEGTLFKSAIIGDNKGIRELKASSDLGLVFAPRDLFNLHFRGYVNVSFEINSSLSSQLGYAILLCDAKNWLHILDHRHQKSRRVIRSVMRGELYTFTDAFDAAMTISEDVTNALGKKVLIGMFTDSKQVVDVITRGKRPTKRRLAINVAREAS